MWGTLQEPAAAIVVMNQQTAYPSCHGRLMIFMFFTVNYDGSWHGICREEIRSCCMVPHHPNYKRHFPIQSFFPLIPNGRIMVHDRGREKIPVGHACSRLGATHFVYNVNITVVPFPYMQSPCLHLSPPLPLLTLPHTLTRRSGLNGQKINHFYQCNGLWWRMRMVVNERIGISLNLFIQIQNRRERRRDGDIAGLMRIKRRERRRSTWLYKWDSW